MVASPEIFSPGVYLEEVAQRRARTFETGVPVFLGQISDGGAESPPFTGNDDLVVPLDFAGWSALETSRGATWAEGYLGFAVRGFFENGGRRCYVTRLSAGTLLTATLEAIDGIEDFDLVCMPDLAAATRDIVLAFFEVRPRCFALLDAPSGKPDEGVVHAAPRSENAALYGPWIKVRGACANATCRGSGMAQGKICTTCWGTGQGFVPPSGHVAGICARTDRRAGPHKPPANEVIEGALDLQVHLDDTTIAVLNGKGLNCLRALPGRGIRVWGARILAPANSGFEFVSERRVFLTITRWLEQAMQDATFEPNDIRLWARINRDVGAFLETLFRRGMLAGASATEAFYLKCDTETNPPAVRAEGKVVTEVGLALARPSEFVKVRLIAGTGEAQIVSAPASP
jgi:hypothetical protein